ncbi:MAG TPA: pyridoxal phosphate-dependent aminotransferase family protein [Candidatus Paceibacterota bacterium]|nr:pyridoxal phosphate-dependent aminotransferase family protein [Candidatus Paceibacterota bacterium]
MGPALQQLDRVFVRYRGRILVYFGGCDYFRLASHPDVLSAARDAAARYGLNVAASRATTGNHSLYLELENALARFFGVDRALLTPSGYATNLVAAQGLASHVTHALIDEQAHASLADAAELLGCQVHRFRHLSPSGLAGRLRRLPDTARPLVLTDGLFAREGTIAPLADYMLLLPRNGLLLVDDAHGAGVLGSSGRGTPEIRGVRRESRLIQTCTLSKAFGTYGGAILGSAPLIGRIVRHSRQFAGSTPLPPPLAAAALKAVRIARSDPGLRSRLLDRVRLVKDALCKTALAQPQTPSPVIAVQARTLPAAARLRKELLRRGIYPSLIRYPGGPPGGYFRFALSSEHTRKQLDALTASLLSVSGLAALRENNTTRQRI